LHHEKIFKHALNPSSMADLWVFLDYHRLNAKSSPEKYSIKGVKECIQEVGFKFFTTLDLITGFWQMMLAMSA
jgi:hypothetical protein